MDLNLLLKNNPLPTLVAKRLAAEPEGFLQKWQEISNASCLGRGRESAAGVLLLLTRRADSRCVINDPHGWVLQLIKRSSLIAQGGDISCPGGMLHPLVDWAFSLLFIRGGILPLPRLYREKASSPETIRRKRIIAMFFANALRESWEEIHLNPLDVSLLGILPTYPLILFRRTIFPLVAVAATGWTPIPNREVAKIVEIPLTTFFTEASYGRYQIQATDPLPGTPSEGPWEFPCLIYADGDEEEILWGATFYFIMNFLKIVFDFNLPDLSNLRIREKTLSSRYLGGSRNGQR